MFAGAAKLNPEQEKGRLAAALFQEPGGLY